MYYTGVGSGVLTYMVQVGEICVRRILCVLSQHSKTEQEANRTKPYTKE